MTDHPTSAIHNHRATQIPIKSAKQLGADDGDRLIWEWNPIAEKMEVKVWKKPHDSMNR